MLQKRKLSYDIFKLSDFIVDFTKKGMINFLKKIFIYVIVANAANRNLHIGTEFINDTSRFPY